MLWKSHTNDYYCYLNEQDKKKAYGQTDKSRKNAGVNESFAFIQKEPVEMQVLFACNNNEQINIKMTLDIKMT